jgi:hypothetical protein
MEMAKGAELAPDVAAPVDAEDAVSCHAPAHFLSELSRHNRRGLSRVQKLDAGGGVLAEVALEQQLPLLLRIAVCPQMQPLGFTADTLSI